MTEMRKIPVSLDSEMMTSVRMLSGDDIFRLVKAMSNIIPEERFNELCDVSKNTAEMTITDVHDSVNNGIDQITATAMMALDIMVTLLGQVEWLHGVMEIDDMLEDIESEGGENPRRIANDDTHTMPGNDR